MNINEYTKRKAQKLGYKHGKSGKDFNPDAKKDSAWYVWYKGGYDIGVIDKDK